MNCQEVMELMQRHVDHDLNEQESSRMKDHVGHCPECAVMLDRLVRLSRGLEQLPRVVPPYSLVDAILPRLNELDDTRPGNAMPAAIPDPLRSRRAAGSRRAWIARVSGAAAVAVVAGLLLMVNAPFRGHSGSGSQQDAASAPEAAQNEMKITATSGSDGPAATASESPSALAVDPDSKIMNQPVQSITRDSAAAGGSTGSAEKGGTAKGAETDSKGKAGVLFTQEVPATEPTGEPAPASPPAAARDTPKGIAGPSSEPPATIMGIASNQEAVSPDGKWKAVIDGGASLKLIQTSDGTVVHENSAGDGTLSNLVWDDDSSKVTYTFTDAQGTQTQIALLVPGAPLK